MGSQDLHFTMPEFPYKFTHVGQKALEEMSKNFHPDGNKSDYEIKEIGFRMAQPIVTIAPKIYNMEVRPDDIWLVTFPKCGTMWTQNIIWNLMTECDKSMDHNTIEKQFPFLEDSAAINHHSTSKMSKDKAIESGRLLHESVEVVEEMKSPRFIKTHLPFEVLPPDLLERAKVVYVCRNAWDCCASFWNHVSQVFPYNYRFKGEHQDFVKMFKDGTFQYGSYWNHLKSAWSRRNHPNLHFMWFEDMKADLDGELEKLQEFLGTRVSGKTMAELKVRVSVEKVQAKATQFLGGEGTSLGASMAKYFQYKGRVSGLKEALKNDETVEEWKIWIKQNLEGTDLPIKIPSE